MKANAKLKYVFLGNLINKINLGEYPNKASEEVKIIHSNSFLVRSRRQTNISTSV